MEQYEKDCPYKSILATMKAEHPKKTDSLSYWQSSFDELKSCLSSARLSQFFDDEFDPPISCLGVFPALGLLIDYSYFNSVRPRSSLRKVSR